MQRMHLPWGALFDREVQIWSSNVFGDHAGTVPQPQAVVYYAQRASKGGLLITEATCIEIVSHATLQTAEREYSRWLISAITQPYCFSPRAH